MWRCPVCEKENSSLLCRGCGFDGSCDYERYPSLGRPAQRPDTVSHRRAVLKAKAAATLHCPKCGGTQFSVAMGTGDFLCSGCAHRFPMAGVQKPVTQTPPASKPVTHTPPVQKSVPPTPPPVQKSVPPTPPPVSKPVTPPAPPVQKPATPPPVKPVIQTPPDPPAKRKRGMLEKLTLGLGWILAGIVIFAMIDGLLQGEDIESFGAVLVFLALNLLMQRRLLRKGFKPLFGSIVPYGLHNFFYAFMAIDFVVTAFVGFYNINISYGQVYDEIEYIILTALVVVMPLYFAFWALGQRGSRKKN